MMADFLLSIIASLLSAMLFLLWKNSLCAKIEISNSISFDHHFNEPCYLVKIKNSTKRSAVNIKAEMFLAKRMVICDKEIEHTKRLELKKTEIIALAPHSKDDKQFSDHVWRFLTFEDIRAVLNSDPSWYVKFVVSAHDSVSGKVATYMRRYGISDIYDGPFLPGNEMTIAGNE